MQYQIDNFKVLASNQTSLNDLIKTKYKLKKDFNIKIISKSIDARKKTEVYLVYRLLIETNEIIKNKDFKEYINKEIDMEYPVWNKPYQPVVVGFGPAGMFASLYLARCKANPIIIERGSKIEDRVKDVDDFINHKTLNINSNIQFGEGGAGTFSDGKLTTNVKNPLINFIIYELYKHGAKEDILYESMPHVGTDVLREVVKNIRLEIESLGGTFHFNTAFLDAYNQDDYLNVITDKEVFKTNHLLLGIGHSAKDTIRHLYHKMKLDMEAKAFSMGVRIEHKAESIDKAQYGDFYKYLPRAYYKLAHHTNEGRGVYTFCMCPGGYVMASTSDEGTIVTNGMSNQAREGVNSNSALLVDVRPEDFGLDPMDGIAYQEKYEKLAYELSGDYKAPGNLVKEFLNDEIASSFRSIKTTYPHGICFTDLKKCLPSFVVEGLKEGIVEFDKRLKGFNNGDAVLVGIESRSSSPVRILRDKETKESSFKGIYPIGEGAGYAGGITSAALDGLLTAIKIV